MCRYRRPVPRSRRPGGKSVGSRVPPNLAGLDPADPDVRAFAAHLDRVSRPSQSGYTMEARAAQAADLAEGVRRARGRRLTLVNVVRLLYLIPIAIVIVMYLLRVT